MKKWPYKKGAIFDVVFPRKNEKSGAWWLVYSLRSGAFGASATLDPPKTPGFGHLKYFLVNLSHGGGLIEAMGKRRQRLPGCILDDQIR